MTPNNHRITVCISCKKRGETRALGYDLIKKIRVALDDARNSIDAPFDVVGAACMAGCSHPCTISYQAPGKATYLFGNIHTSEDIDDLVTFARQYAILGDGWCSSVDRPGKLRTQTLARIPSMNISTPDDTTRQL